MYELVSISIYFLFHKDNSMLLKTNPSITSETNQIELMDRTTFSFRLRTCSDALITLRSSHDDQTSLLPDYQFHIGALDSHQASTYGRIELTIIDADGRPVVKTVDVTDLLNCNEFRRFWISWKEGRVEIGRDELYSNSLLFEYDPIIGRTLRTLRLGSKNQQVIPEWEYSLVSGQVVGSSNPSQRYSNVFRFSVF